MKLTKHEAEHPIWQKLKVHMSERLDALREQNDSAALSEVETAQIRGRIKEIKQLMMLDEPDLVEKHRSRVQATNQQRPDGNSRRVKEL